MSVGLQVGVGPSLQGERRGKPGLNQKGRGGPTPEERRDNPHSKKRRVMIIITIKLKTSVTITMHKNKNNYHNKI